MGICGTNAGELIAEPTLAIEMGCDMSGCWFSFACQP
jgi:dihydrolipoamide dehydrogenase